MGFLEVQSPLSEYHEELKIVLVSMLISVQTFLDLNITLIAFLTKLLSTRLNTTIIIRYPTTPNFVNFITSFQGTKVVFPNGSFDPWKS